MMKALELTRREESCFLRELDVDLAVAVEDVESAMDPSRIESRRSRRMSPSRRVVECRS